jgi:hypothetical protein
MQEETNVLVVRSLLKNNYFYKYYDRAQKSLHFIPKLLKAKIAITQKRCFERISKHQALGEHASRNSMTGSDSRSKREILNLDRSRSFTKLKEDK